MFYNPYSNFHIKSKKSSSTKLIHNNYSTTPLLNSNILTKALQNNYLPLTSRPKNYINYTFLDKNKNYILKAKPSKTFHKKALHSHLNKRPKLTIVNDYLKSFQKSSSNWVNSLKLTKENNINFKASRNIDNNPNKEANFNFNNYNNYFNEETTNRDNISKISNNLSYKTFLNENNGSTQTKIEPYEEMKIVGTGNISDYSKVKIRSVINSSMPIFKKIKVLKEAKCSINKFKRNNKVNCSSSFKTFYEESNTSKNSLDKIKNIFEINNYKDYYYNNNIDNKRPIIIKYMPKPKLSVPKYSNVNSMKII